MQEPPVSPIDNSFIFPQLNTKLPEDGIFVQKCSDETILKQEINAIKESFNAFDWSRDELLAAAFAFLVDYHLSSIFNVTHEEIFELILEIEKTYTENPYHCFKHAVDVQQFTYYLITYSGASHFLLPVEAISLLLAALFHDSGHPGYNNLFQVNAKTDLALRYNNVSVLENHSVTIAKETLERLKFLDKISFIDKALCLSFITNVVIATDMSSHFNLLEQFAGLVDAYQSDTSFDFNPDDRLLLSKVILHAADISNACRPWKTCKEWSDLVIDEFYRQGDLEIKLNLPVSPNMNRETSEQRQISINFNDIIVRPLFMVMNDLFQSLSNLIDSLNNNRDRWEIMEIQHESKSNFGSISELVSVNTKTSDSKTSISNINSTANNPRRLSIAAGIVTIPDNFISHINNTSTLPASKVFSKGYASSRTSVSHTPKSTYQSNAGSNDSVNLEQVSFRNIFTISQTLRSYDENMKNKTESLLGEELWRNKRHSVMGAMDNRQFSQSEKRSIWDRWNDNNSNYRFNGTSSNDSVTSSNYPDGSISSASLSLSKSTSKAGSRRESGAKRSHFPNSKYSTLVEEPSSSDKQPIQLVESDEIDNKLLEKLNLECNTEANVRSYEELTSEFSRRKSSSDPLL
ncbi:HD-domain/PDEase-like protein [Rozella allomycis CSF55]|uniref:3'5'-cyclic nucleotide phosphodiesterase, catalytic domain-containing protein n=1 Tax=Rozella allomycis (strain CSF55) TaxID=988480 RepID=A0A075AWB1_ROZAC|nr:3'5'-cyclic nucleotide phosphodiesterase, catalytic domain-containing protein [Rozella allomycis CSF55]RKP21696.1 HD-domain/PDEase-like protein [Rozella allomycis CSF55]|eukprot:EPZ34540.1 3'5'-cyclic nucleotide phosphodiesterase, catalytic domain-containing protein [Rozella allomycis CSF55]